MSADAAQRATRKALENQAKLQRAWLNGVTFRSMSTIPNWPNCFELYRGVFSHVDYQTLEDSIPWEQKTATIYGKRVAQPRLTCWWGPAGYTYSGQTHEARDVPDTIKLIGRQLRNVSEHTDRIFNSCLANRYRDGRDSVAKHQDNEPELGPEPVIASLSFGATRKFTIWNKRFGSLSVDLRHGDVVVMFGRSQLDWHHAVPKTARVVGPRINLTFRTIK